MRSGWVVVGAAAVGGCMGSRTPVDGGGDGIAFVANGDAGAIADADANADGDAGAGGGSDASLVYPAVPGMTVLSFVVPDAADACATRTPAGWCWVAPRPQGMPLRDASSPRAGE